MDLSQLRQQIDTIDRQIVNLYEERMDVSRQVAEYKIETGKKVFDKQREQEKIAGVKALTHNDFNSHGVEELFEQIMSMSRKLQYQLLAAHGSEGRLPFIGVEELETDCARVVYQGAEGSYSQAAMRRFFGENVNAFHVETFRDAMSAIDEGSADFAVLPIENSTAGIVNEIYDLLVEFENYIVGEQVIPIEHCLLALPGTKMEEIKRVYSVPVLVQVFIYHGAVFLNNSVPINHAVIVFVVLNLCLGYTIQKVYIFLSRIGVYNDVLAG